jgi:hypothetical protein
MGGRVRGEPSAGRGAGGRNGPRGVTVLETTVVIIVFGILLSILMPSIGLLRENALSARCQQHLRSLGIAISAYMSDYHGKNWLPASRLPDGPFWFEKLEPFVGGHEAGRSRENFVCPRAPFGQRGFTRDSLSYGWNERHLPLGTVDKDIVRQAETIAIADSLPGPDSDTVLTPQGQLRFATRHRDKGGVLFLAGNVDSMGRAEAEFEWPRYWDRQ